MKPSPLILLVDDNATILMASTRILERAGYRVAQAVDGADALRKVRSLRPSLVLLDIVLPDLTGNVVLSEIRKDPGLVDISVVLLSSVQTSPEEQASGLDAGADGYIARPIGQAELVARVRLHLRQRELTDQLRASEARLVAAQAVAKVGSWETDLETLAVVWSEETHRIFETDMTTFAPTHQAFLDIIHPDDRRSVDEAFVQSFKETSASSIEHRVTVSGGRIKFLEERWRVIHDANGKALRAFGTCQDITERKQAEERIRQREALLRIAGKAARLGGWTLQLPERKYTWSDENCAIHDLEPGYQPTFDEAVNFFPPAHRAEAVRCLEACEKEGIAYEFDAPKITAKGRAIWVRSIGEAVRDPDGKIIRLQGAVQDITERKKGEELLRQKDALLRIAGRVTHTGGWAVDVPSQRVYWSDDVFDILEFPRGTFSPLQEALALIAEPRRSEMIAALDACARDGTPFDVEIEMKTLRGRPIWARIAAEADRDADGKILRVQGALKDISERKKAEQALRASEARFRTVIQSSWDVFHLIEPGGRIVYESPAVTRVLGYDPEELEGHNVFEFIHPDDVSTLANTMPEQLASPGAMRTVVVRVRHKNGSWRWVEAFEVNLVDHPDVRALAVNYRDITERKRAEEEMRRANETLEGIVAALQEIATSDLAVAPVMQVMAGHAQTLTGADGGVVELVDGPEMVYAAATGAAADKVGLRLKLSGSLSGLAVQTGKPMICDDSEDDDRVDREACRKVGVRSMVVVPMREGSEVIGVLKVLDNRIRAFSPRDVSNLQILVESLGAVIQRRRATEQLISSEAQYRLLFLSNPNPMWVFDLQTLRFLAVNEAARRHYGYSEEEFLAQDIHAVQLPDEQTIPEWDSQFLGSGGKKSNRMRHRKKDGTIIEVEVASDDAEFQDRRARLVLINDVTERVRAETELARANRALKMLSRCNEALIRVESESVLLAEICQIAVETGGFCMAWVGYAEDDVGRSIVPQAKAGGEDGYLRDIKVSWREDLAIGRGPAGEAIRTGQAVIVSDLKKNDAFHPWQEAALAQGYRGVVVLPLKGKSRAFGVLVLFLPEVRALPPNELSMLQELADNLTFGIVTLRLRAEQRLAQREIARQAALIDQTQDAIIVRDLDHAITFWSRGAERLYGWTATEVMGRVLNKLLKMDATTFSEADRSVRGRGEWSGEVQKISKSKSALMVSSRWTLLRDDEGQPKAVLTVDTDVTERKKLEAQFLRSQRMESIGTLAGGIAHDLNNLLSPIVMGIGMLKQLDCRPDVLDTIDNIERSARRGADLVKQVLSFARGVDVARVTLHLDDILGEIESIVKTTFPKNIVFEWECPASLWPVVGDPTQINQVLLNLCLNARDALPNGGRLTISVRNSEVDEQYAVMNRGAKAGSYVLLEVSDTGGGIPHEIIDRIFEPFFTTKELGKGTGLGLSTALGIVRSHGGFLNVYSEIDKGSTFKVYLPVVGDALPSRTSNEQDGVLPRGQGELLMVVDDDTAILDIMKKTLEFFGYRVIVAQDGARAVGLYALNRAEVAVVLTDMMMPVMDGPALIAALRHIDPKVRIIAASGLNATSNIARAAQVGVNHFLGKPYSAEVLLVLLKKVLAE